MAKRLVSANASDIIKMNAEELKNSIKASEGRVVLTEIVATREAYEPGITGAEIACAFGSNMVLLNGVDIFAPVIEGLGQYDDDNFVELLKKYTGRPIGLNLEPVDTEADMLEDRVVISKGRQASKETFLRANEVGLDFVCLTGNPGVGVSNEAVINAVKIGKENFDGLIIAGKMHGAGVNEPVITVEIAKEIIDAGADIILVPSIGSVPGLRPEQVYEVVDYAHSKDILVMSAIGTSQETSDSETIKRMAIDNKIAGVDIQHIGDAGYHGMSIPENIYDLSVAIRGRRHTITSMSRSINR